MSYWTVCMTTFEDDSIHVGAQPDGSKFEDLVNKPKQPKTTPLKLKFETGMRFKYEVLERGMGRTNAKRKVVEILTALDQHGEVLVNVK